MKRPILAVLVLTILLLPITGCTYRSGPKTLEVEEQNKSVSNPRAKVIIEKAIDKTDREGRKFWYNGWIATKVQKRKTTSMYSGTFDRDLGYLVKARVMGQDFRYYRYRGDVYVSEGDNWVKAPSTKTPLDPFDGFRPILPFAQKARQLPDEKILGRDCYVFEIALNGNDVARISKEISQSASNELENFLLDQLEMKYRLWVGKKDSYIYQLKTEALMPAPEAGSMFQEVYYRFWDYNSPSITLTEPENIIKYLKKD